MKTSVVAERLEGAFDAPAGPGASRVLVPRSREGAGIRRDEQTA